MRFLSTEIQRESKIKYLPSTLSWKLLDEGKEETREGFGSKERRGKWRMKPKCSISQLMMRQGLRLHPCGHLIFFRPLPVRGISYWQIRFKKQKKQNNKTKHLCLPGIKIRFKLTILRLPLGGARHQIKLQRDCWDQVMFYSGLLQYGVKQSGISSCALPPRDHMLQAASGSISEKRMTIGPRWAQRLHHLPGTTSPAQPEKWRFPGRRTGATR